MERLGRLELGGGGEVEVVAVGEEVQGFGRGGVGGGADEDGVQADDAREAVSFQIHEKVLLYRLTH